MKVIMFIFTLFISLNSFGDAFFENGLCPDFLPHVGRALPGRCYLATGSNKKIASVLLVTFDLNGFQVAPFDGERESVDYFDNMSYEQVLRRHPMASMMFLDVKETPGVAIIKTEHGEDLYQGEMRESEKHIILRVFTNNKLHKYCNYVKDE